jgi:hypothetical protein
MNSFDKICAGCAFVLGLVLLALGAIGTLTGCRAHFSLPPILGAMPAFVGWGIVRAVYFAWNGPMARSNPYAAMRAPGLDEDGAEF